VALAEETADMIEELRTWRLPDARNSALLLGPVPDGGSLMHEPTVPGLAG